MFVAGNFISAIASILDTILQIYMWIVIVAALLSWVSPDPYNPIVRFLYRVTDPVFRPIRNIIGTIGGIDISPIIVLAAIWFLRAFVVTSLRELAFRLAVR